jgi:hypothetical protein
MAAAPNTQQAMWRKNRNPASSGGNAARIGVDVNRNYDFLWDFVTKFSPNANMNTLASTDPGNDLFHGTGPFSEPESRNVQWLVGQFPNSRYFVDVHSYTGDVLHAWGDDENQSVEILSGTCFAVGALRDPAGLQFLETTSRRPEVPLVRAALEAAGQFSQPEAFAILARLVAHDSPEVRADVLSSLSSRHDEAVLQLLEQVGQKDPSDDLRETAYRSMTQYKPPQVVPYLIERLKDASAATRPAVLETLGQLTGQSLGANHDAWARWWAKNGAGAGAR